MLTYIYQVYGYLQSISWICVKVNCRFLIEDLQNTYKNWVPNGVYICNIWKVNQTVDLSFLASITFLMPCLLAQKLKEDENFKTKIVSDERLIKSVLETPPCQTCEFVNNESHSLKFSNTRSHHYRPLSMIVWHNKFRKVTVS